MFGGGKGIEFAQVYTEGNLLQSDLGHIRLAHGMHRWQRSGVAESPRLSHPLHLAVLTTH